MSRPKSLAIGPILSATQYRCSRLRTVSARLSGRPRTAGESSYRLMRDDWLAEPLNVAISFPNRTPTPIRDNVVVGTERAR